MKVIITFSEVVGIALATLWFVWMLSMLLPILIRQWWENRKHKKDKNKEDM